MTNKQKAWLLVIGIFGLIFGPAILWWLLKFAFKLLGFALSLVFGLLGAAFTLVGFVVVVGLAIYYLKHAKDND